MHTERAVIGGTSMCGVSRGFLGCLFGFLGGLRGISSCSRKSRRKSHADDDLWIRVLT